MSTGRKRKDHLNNAPPGRPPETGGNQAAGVGSHQPPTNVAFPGILLDREIGILLVAAVAGDHPAGDGILSSGRILGQDIVHGIGEGAIVIADRILVRLTQYLAAEVDFPHQGDRVWRIARGQDGVILLQVYLPARRYYRRV